MFDSIRYDTHFSRNNTDVFWEQNYAQITGRLIRTLSASTTQHVEIEVSSLPAKLPKRNANEICDALLSIPCKTITIPVWLSKNIFANPKWLK